MAETVQGLVDDVINEGNVDATSPHVLRDLNRRFSQMLSDARAYRKTVSLGTTVATQAFYPTPVIELYSLAVDGVPYDRAVRRDGYWNDQDRLWWWPSELGLAYPDASSAAVKGVTLIPTPDTTGLAITGFASVQPPDLTLDAAGDALLVANLENDLMGRLVAGVMAERYWREGRADQAGVMEQRFADGVQRLRQRATRRVRNTGPTQIRLAS